MSNELVSVILPIYNVELYLKKCIESVIMQSYKNMEIILVDDGSTDQSPYICDEYAKMDSRIMIIQNIIRRGVIWVCLLLKWNQRHFI